MRRPSLRRARRPTLVIVPLLAIVGMTCPAVDEAALRPAPAGLRLTSATASTMTLAWDDVSGSPAYRVAYSTSPAMTDAEKVDFADNGGTIRGLRAGRRYWVRVAVADTTGRTLSGYAEDYAVARTLYPVGYPLRAPTKVAVVKTKLTSLELDWGPVVGAPGYRVQVATARAMVRPRTVWFADDAGVVPRLDPGSATTSP